VERLLGRIQMVELERRFAAAIAAEHARAAGLGNEHALDPSPMFRDPFGAASGAAIAAAVLEHVHDDAVVEARQRC